MLKSKDQLRGGNLKNSDLKDLLESEMNTLFRLTHHNVFRIQIQVFKLLLQFAKTTQSLSKNELTLEKADGQEKGENKIQNFADRFYRTLYELLLKVHMGKATSLDEYFGLVFKAVKSDKSVPRCLAFVKRLLQMTFVNEANFTAATLLIISEILKVRMDIKLQLFTGNFGGQKSQVTQVSTVKLDQAGSDDDDEERFVDVDKLIVQPNQQPVQIDLTNTNQTQAKDSKKQPKAQYDAYKREPQYANAETQSLNELVALSYHSHPTVRLWSQNLLKGESIPDYKGDPLQDFSISNFLDRIAYKDPKSKEKLEKFASKSTRMASYEKPVNEYDFKNGERPEIEREEEAFMYKYLELKEKKKKTLVDSDAEVDEDASDPEMEAFAD